MISPNLLNNKIFKKQSSFKLRRCLVVWDFYNAKDLFLKLFLKLKEHIFNYKSALKTVYNVKM